MTLTLIFTLGGDVYGLEINAIQEIAEDPPLHYVPRAEGVLTGAINFHGRILAVINLPELLGFESVELDHRRIVLTSEFKSLALTVCSIEKIVKLDLSELQPPPENTRSKAIRGVVNLDDMIVNLLDTDEVINLLENRYSE